MGRPKKTIEELDPDYNPDGSRIARTYETYILKPIEKLGIAYESGNASDSPSFITYSEVGTGATKKLYTEGYHRDIANALQTLYSHVVNVRIVKATKQKNAELELSEIKIIFEQTHKEFSKLWLKLTK